ncbi:unnamed protein product [Nippostrongylus brasiliensis]|uniref:Miff domain-containing protein n=1 Tax=Nippostrongylus brasiliensis TaxID=27835 RepID=A0A0N4XUG0_NIPBR|nr:unnamed protein product [Nippostrongylus brasiliensis]
MQSKNGSHGKDDYTPMLGRGEQADAPIKQSLALKNVKLGLPIKLTDNKYKLFDWQYDVPEKCFDPESLLETHDLLQDKACSAEKKPLPLPAYEQPAHSRNPTIDAP